VTQELTHIDLFSGIGGFSLACREAGIKTVCFVEINEFCRKVLQKNFPGVPIHEDIKTFTNDKNYRPFILTGGFPCQPFSVAGKRRGTADDRYLWPEMLRVIKEFNPRWVIAENVPGIINLKHMEQQDCDTEMESEALDDGSDSQPATVLISILDDLEQAGYSVQVFVILACAVGACHRRDRVWIVAHTDTGWTRRYAKIAPDTISNSEGGAYGENIGECVTGRQEPDKCQWNEMGRNTSNSNCHAPDTDINGLQWGKKTGNIGFNGTESKNKLTSRLPCLDAPWIEVASRLCVMDDGLSSGLVGYLGITEEHLKHRNKHRVRKIEALGNAIVPQVAYEIIKAILDAEKMYEV